MEVSKIDINKILFTDIIKKYNKQYYLIYYDLENNILNINLKNITIDKTIRSLSNKKHIKIYISKEQFNYINKIESKIIDFISKNKNEIYTDNVNIDKLFFSNIEHKGNKYLLNLSVDKNFIIFVDKNIDINLKVYGIWLYENMFGVSYSVDNT